MTGGWGAHKTRRPLRVGVPCSFPSPDNLNLVYALRLPPGSHVRGWGGAGDPHVRGGQSLHMRMPRGCPTNVRNW
jgi:hypothetical protein